MKQVTTPTVRIIDPSRLLPLKNPSSTTDRRAATSKPTYPPIKMPVLPVGFYKGRDQDCL